MNILFVTSTPFLMEPLGVMLLMAICRREGHAVRLAVLRRHRLERVVAEFGPDVVAYSTQSADLSLFKKADAAVLAAAVRLGKRPFRIMGGAHPTFAPEVLEEMGLDAICQGDGDDALPAMLKRLEEGRALDGIPNLVARGMTGASSRALTQDLDRLPFPDRAAFYEAMPYCRTSGLRSFLSGRGCPYNCSYCFNHAFNRMFRGCGPVLRRRSVDDVLDEIAQVRRDFPPLKLVRFADDTFVHRADDWLCEFAEKYPARIGVPFYCLMRSNTLTEETARLLARTGCQSIGMSIETGDEQIRNDILRRNLTDKQVIASFALAEKYGIKTYASTMIGIPGTKTEDDYNSLKFARSIRPSAPLFTICTPYRGTDIWQQCVEKEYVEADGPEPGCVGAPGQLHCFNSCERAIQARACYFGSLYATAPGWAAPLVLRLIKGPFPLLPARYAGFTYTAWRIATQIFPQAIPRTPMGILRIGLDSVRYLL